MATPVTTNNPRIQQSVSVRGAQQLANKTKTRAQIQGLTPRWLLHLLPWVSVEAGVYRVNRRKLIDPVNLAIPLPRPDGHPVLSASSLRQIPRLRKLEEPLLQAMAGRFNPRRVSRGETVIPEGESGNQLLIVADGKLEVTGYGVHGEPLSQGLLREGDYLDTLLNSNRRNYTVKALTSAEVLVLDRGQFDTILNEAPQLRTMLDGSNSYLSNGYAPHNAYGESDFRTITSYGDGDVVPGSYVDYEETPREYTLSTLQTTVQIRTTIADLYNNPYDQLREQMRQAVETIKERQEWELINNRDFGLLHNV